MIQLEELVLAELISIVNLLGRVVDVLVDAYLQCREYETILEQKPTLWRRSALGVYVLVAQIGANKYNQIVIVK